MDEKRQTAAQEVLASFIESLAFERMGHLTEIAMIQGQKRGLVIWGFRIPVKGEPS